MRDEPEAVRPLAELVHRKTLGNPFFINRLMTSLHEQGVLRLDGAGRHWMWDVEAIHHLGVSDNVADLMASQLRQLPENTLSLLRFASCIGHRFQADMLSALSGLPVPEVVRLLVDAVREDFIAPLDESYLNAQWSTGDEANCQFGSIGYRFLHDRIHEAAYSQISEEERANLHYRIGTFLLESTPQQELEDRCSACTWRRFGTSSSTPRR